MRFSVNTLVVSLLAMNYDFATGLAVIPIGFDLPSELPQPAPGPSALPGHPAEPSGLHARVSAESNLPQPTPAPLGLSPRDPEPAIKTSSRPRPVQPGPSHLPRL